jgi:nitrogen fixation/metabolism regulation signal transduction histidine kinase
MRRHFSSAPAQVRALIDECTTTIVGEVESLKGLVDEFSQFARMPSPRTVPTELRQLIVDTLALYNGIFADVRIDMRCAPRVPLVRLDPEQIRRVIINLVDNAVEAARTGRRRPAWVETSIVAEADDLHLVVVDSGDGVPAEAVDRLFEQGYTTSGDDGRPHGIGLALARQTARRHGGELDLTRASGADCGAVFVARLPGVVRAREFDAEPAPAGWRDDP